MKPDVGSPLCLCRAQVSDRIRRKNETWDVDVGMEIDAVMLSCPGTPRMLGALHWIFPCTFSKVVFGAIKLALNRVNCVTVFLFMTLMACFLFRGCIISHACKLACSHSLA